MKTYPLFPNRIRHDLNGLWDFTLLEDVAFDDIDPSTITWTDRMVVPSAFDAYPAYAGKRGAGIYRCFANVAPGRRSLLKIGGAGMRCRVWVDGIALAEHIGTYTPFEVEVEPSDSPRREIVVATDNRFDFDRCPLHEIFFDFHNYGGIIRQVWLDELSPGMCFRGIRVMVDDENTGEIRLVLNHEGERGNILVSIDGGAPVPTNVIRAEDGEVELSARVPEPQLWSPAQPRLHTVTASCGEDAVTTRFGLRRVTAENGRILVNGAPIKLLGYCRHEAHPQFGPALPDAQLLADLQILRDLGCNFIRGSHYQQDPRFLDLCDEMGFLVFSESLGWGQSEAHFQNEAFAEAQLRQTEAMVLADFNHPSIIVWGFLNEGQSDVESAVPFYTRMFELIRSLDPSRLVTSATNRRIKDLMLEQQDVLSFNIYPGWYSWFSKDACDEHPLHEVNEQIDTLLRDLAERGLGDKPVLISEIGAGAIYGWRDAHHAHWSEEYQRDLLGEVCRRVVGDDRLCGVALWQFCDCRTYQGGLALKRPRAFNNKGTLDEYRRPKLAYDTVRKIFREPRR